VAFSVSENWFFLDFLNELQPLYEAPSRYVLSHSIMDAEAARVELEEIVYMKDRKRLAFLIDDWEDTLRRSLYGSVAAEVGQYPSVLSLTDMTGNRATAENILKAAADGLKIMELEGGRNIIAVTTDNPSVMQSFRNKFQEKYFWVLVRRWNHVPNCQAC
jgi:hypothetical protein